MAEDDSTTAVLEPADETADTGRDLNAQTPPDPQQPVPPDSDTSSDNQQKSAFRQIRVGKDHAFVVNGQQVALFDAPAKARGKAEIVLPGYHLNIYDQVFLRVGQSRYAPVNLHRAYGDTESISFNLPDFDKLLKEGDPLWIELVSSASPEASGTLFPYVIYTQQKEEEGGEAGGAESTAKKSKKTESEEKAGAGAAGGLGSLAVAAGGEALSGVLSLSSNKSDAGKQQRPLKDRLKEALRKGDRKAIKESIDEAKKNKDTKTLKELSGEYMGPAERYMFDEALGDLGVLDFSPRPVSGPGFEQAVAGGGEAGGGEGEERVVSVAGSEGVGHEVGHRVVAQGATTTARTLSESATVSGRQTLSTSGTAEVSVYGTQSSTASGSVSAKTQSEVSGEVEAEQSANIQQTISGQTGGGQVGARVSVQSETELEQQTENEAKVVAQGQTGGRSVQGKTEVTNRTAARVGQEVKSASPQPEMEMEAEAEMSASVSGNGIGSVPNEAGTIKTSAFSDKPGRATGGGGAGVQATVTQEAGGGGRGPAEASVTSTAQYGVAPLSQGSTIRADIQIPGSAPSGVRVTASIPKPSGRPAVLQGEIEQAGSKSAAGQHDGIGVQASGEEEIGARLKEKNEGPEEEQAVLAQIPEEAKRLVATFKAQSAGANGKRPGAAPKLGRTVSVPTDEEVGGKVGGPAKAPPQSGQKSSGLDGIQPGAAQPEAEPAAPDGKNGSPRGVARDRVAAGAGQAANELGRANEGLAPALPPKTNAEPGQAPEQEPGLEPETAAEKDGQPGEAKSADEKQENEEEAQAQQQQQAAQQQNQVASALRQAKLDDESLKKVTKEANLALDKFLMEGVEMVWAGAIETFGLTVLLGAIIGDFLWMFKNSIIRGVLKPLLRTEFLKKKAEQIAKQIKISVKVKLNILAMNLIVAAAVMLVLFILFVLLWVGCNYPPGITRLSYRFSVVGLAGGSSICESLDSATSGFTGFAGGDSGGGGASGSWACQALTSGDASVQNLSNTCFGANASKASAIAGAESGGVTTSESSVDKCTVDGSVVSFGLFQINISAQNNFAGLNCRSAFDKMYTAQTKNCRVINKPLYDQCVAAAKDAQKNIQQACQISGNGTNWSLWGANQKCGF